MLEILTLLNESDIIRDAEILSLLKGKDYFYLKVKSFLINGSLLFVRIYLSDIEYNYSFHWQDEQENLIARWDNAAHHPEIETYPHHIHTPNGIKESYDITLLDILEQIKGKLRDK